MKAWYNFKPHGQLVPKHWVVLRKPPILLSADFSSSSAVAAPSSLTPHCTNIFVAKRKQVAKSMHWDRWHHKHI